VWCITTPLGKGYAALYRCIPLAIDKAPRNFMFAELHLQVIKYADDLKDVSGKDFCAELDLGKSWGTEFNKMEKIASRLKEAGLVQYTKRGFYIATDEGRKVLAKKPERIDNKFLKKYDAFQEFQNRKGKTNGSASDTEIPVNDSNATPDEILRAAHSQINASLAGDLLDKVRQSSPQFFEELIIGLLLAMGYGGTSEDAARALGQSGDNGVDGVVDQDPLGVDQIYVQAKRYAEGNTVGAGDIRDFFGALNLKKAQKGIFFTTSSFSHSAIQTAKGLGMRIVLIDAQKLAKLMIKYRVGCRDEETLYLKKMDDEFFEQ